MTRRYPLVLGLTLAVFAGVVASVTLRLRAGLQEQILLREGDTLAAVAAMQLEASDEELAKIGVGDSPFALFAAVLKSSRLSGVIAIRVFDGKGAFLGAVPVAWRDTTLPPPPTAALLGSGTAVARLHRSGALRQLAGVAAFTAKVPWLEIWVPLRREGIAAPAGSAQFWIDGRPLTAEFSQIDRRLALQALLAWAAGSGLIALILAWNFRRLAAAHGALEARSADLARANRELSLAAKASALGAVTAHLFHEIRRPLAGLEGFVEGRNGEATPASGEEWAAAAALTRRLRETVESVTSVLRDEEAGVSLELTGAELASEAADRAQAAAKRCGVAVMSRAVGARVVLTGSRANLAGLILKNLLENACEASPPGATVWLESRALGADQVEFQVEDRGSGLPEGVRENLFQPCASAKPGGSGLGLALSRHLALHAGGRLELVGTGPEGSCFRLVMPAG